MQSPPAFLQQRLEFPFASAEARAGLPLSNGLFGALLWGVGRTLHVTINRADYTPRGSVDGDDDPLAMPMAAAPDLPMGRLDMHLPPDWSVAAGGLHLLTGEAEIELTAGRSEGAWAKVRASVLRETPVLCLRITGLDGAGVHVRSRPPDAPEVLEEYRDAGIPRPQAFDMEEFGGWVQERPRATALCAAWLRHATPGGLLLFVASAYGDSAQEARRHALLDLETARGEGYTPATLRTFAWWRKWWDEAVASGGADSVQHLRASLERYRQGAPPDPHAPECLREEAPPPARRGSSPGLDERTVIRVSRAGDLWLCSRGAELPAGHLRPPFLDGPALEGHLPEPRRLLPPAIRAAR